MAPVLYAESPARRFRQVTADIVVLAWTGLWVWLGLKIHDTIMLLSGPGAALTDAGESLAGNMRVAGDRIGSVPLLGDSARAPFDSMGGAGTALADAGRTQQQVVTNLALLLAGAVALLAVALVVAVWLPVRVRFIRRATAARRYLDNADDLDLFALRALARQPLHVLARIADDPAAAWRRRDPVIVPRLAELELREEGLRMPAQHRSGGSLR